jgi:colicin import membrane protein
MARSERPRPARQIKGKWWALLLAIAVQLAFLAVIVFSVTWQNRAPQAVTAELYAPPVRAPAAEPTPAPAEPTPEAPPPTPAPTPVPPPVPKATPVPVPKVERADPRAAEIALKAKQEEERRKKVDAERKEADKKLRDAKEAEDKRKLEERRKQDEKRVADTRERQQRETDALRAQADREAKSRAQAEKDAQNQAREAAEASALARAKADWVSRIQAKVKGNVIVPPDLAGNPTAIFDVVQLPTGEIIEATLRKSSGSRAYDDAVQRAILKSSPLPRPERAELFARSLTLNFRPTD